MALSISRKSIIKRIISSSSLFSRSIKTDVSASQKIISPTPSSSFSSSSSYNVNMGGSSSYMRGFMFTNPNQPLVLEDFRMPQPKANEILVKNKACGVCHSDLHVIKGELPFASPCVLGHEITGEVVEHGPLTDSRITQRLDNSCKQ